ACAARAGQGGPGNDGGRVPPAVPLDGADRGGRVDQRSGRAGRDPRAGDGVQTCGWGDGKPIAVPTSSLARANTSYHIARVSFPVLVFCRLGWNETSSVRPSGRTLSAAWAKGGRSAGRSRSHHPLARSQLSQATRPSTRTTLTEPRSAISRSR